MQRGLPRARETAGPRRRSGRRSHGRMRASRPDAPRMQLALQVMNSRCGKVGAAVASLVCCEARTGVDSSLHANFLPPSNFWSFLSYRRDPENTKNFDPSFSPPKPSHHSRPNQGYNLTTSVPTNGPFRLGFPPIINQVHHSQDLPVYTKFSSLCTIMLSKCSAPCLQHPARHLHPTLCIFPVTTSNANK